MNKSAEPFVRIPRRFADARRMGELSAGAFELGCWIAYRADFMTGRFIASLGELHNELERETSKETLRRQIQELHPDWLDFDVRAGQRKPWVFQLTGLWKNPQPNPRPPHDLLAEGVFHEEVTSTALLGEEGANPLEQAAGTSTRPPHEPADKREEEVFKGSSQVGSVASYVEEEENRPGFDSDKTSNPGWEVEGYERSPYELERSEAGALETLADEAHSVLEAIKREGEKGIPF